MPHFVVHCSQSALAATSQEAINQAIHEVARDSGLFDENDIKVRVLPFDTYLVGGKEQDFAHVFASIMQGRTEAQRAALSRSVVGRLKEMLPHLPFIAMNVDEFEKSTYCNLKSL